MITAGADLRQYCRFCAGKRCLHCETLIYKAYARQFPNGPEPLITFALQNPEDLELAQAVCDVCTRKKEESV